MGVLRSKEVTFTETATAGVYTGSVATPAGAVLVDIIVTGVALWDTATSATMKVGDVADDDRFYTAVNLKATDLLAGEQLRFRAPGGKQGVDLDASEAVGAQIRNAYSASSRVISGIVTTVGSGTAGRTRMNVLWEQETTYSSAAATKV